MSQNGIVKALSFCVLGLLIVSTAACSRAPRRVDTYTNASGAVTVLENDRESCVRSCNAEYDRCGDTNAAQEVVGRGQMTGIFGGQADCRDDLRSCLARCKSR